MGPTGGEGAKQWMNMLTELRNRGVADVCIVCCYAVVVVMPMMLGRSRSAAVGGLRLSA